MTCNPMLNYIHFSAIEFAGGGGGGPLWDFIVV